MPPPVASLSPSITPTWTQEPVETDSNGLFSWLPGLPPLDLDEATQGLAGGIGYAKIILQGGLSSLYTELQNIGLLLKSAPMEYIASLISPGETLTECSVALGIDASILTLSLLAIKGGNEGQDDAGERKVELSNKRAFLESVAKDTAQSFERKDFEKFEEIQKHELNLITVSEKRNAHDEAIGKASLRAGKAIRNKTLVELCAHIVLAAVNSILIVGVGSGISLSFAISASVLSLALGIWAAMSAVRLGRAFHAKTKEEKKWAQAEREAIGEYVQRVEDKAEAAEIATMCLSPAKLSADIDREREMVTAYLESIQEEARYREEFANSFYRWNLGFLTSTSLYGSSAIFQNALVTLPALAGFTALANPVVLGVLLASGMFGSIAMAICSQQFLYMPDEQKRYDQQLDQYLPQIQPNLKTPIDLDAQLYTVLEGPSMGMEVPMELFKTAMPSPAQSPTLSLKQSSMPSSAQPPMSDLSSDSVDRNLIIATDRFLGIYERTLLQAATHKRIDAQEKARRTFLNAVAENTNKNYNAKFFRWQSVTDKPVNAPDFSHSCKAALSVMGVLVRVFANPVRMAELLRQAREEWNAKRNTLTIETLNAFLKTEGKSSEIQSEFMKCVFKAERDYLEVKDKTYEEIKNKIPNIYSQFKDQHIKASARRDAINKLIQSDNLLALREGFINMQKPKDESAESTSFQKGKISVDQAMNQDFVKCFWEFDGDYKKGHSPDSMYETRRGVNFVLAGSLAPARWA